VQVVNAVRNTSLDLRVDPAPEIVDRASPGTSPRAGRDPFFDNAKLLLIVLVVVGHGIRPLVDVSHALRAVYLFVYSFHMPAMILICGYFSRNFTYQPAKIRRLISSVLVPYLLFECVYELLLDYYDGGRIRIAPMSPRYLMWFLISLFLWRLTGPIWRLVRAPIVLAFAISLFGGITQIPTVLSLGRTLQFLPWFVIGMFLRREHFELLTRPAVRWSAPVVAVCSLAGAYLVAPRVSIEWLYMSKGYAQIGSSFVVWLPVRLFQYALAAVLIASFLAWVPRRKIWYSSLGAGTMYSYLLHGLVVKSLLAAGFFRLAPVRTHLGIAVLVLALAGLGLLLATRPVRRLFHWAVEPSANWLFAPDPTPPARSARPIASPRPRTVALPDTAGGVHTPISDPDSPASR
jgi:fucose 4-O-acetylase-like acetyltransferase